MCGYIQRGLDLEEFQRDGFFQMHGFISIILGFVPPIHDFSNLEQPFAEFFEKIAGMESLVGMAVLLTRSVLTDFGLLTDFFCKSGLF